MSTDATEARRLVAALGIDDAVQKVVAEAPALPGTAVGILRAASLPAARTTEGDHRAVA